MAEANRSDAKFSRPEVSTWLRITATLLRIVFIVLLGILTLRVTVPERETLFSTYVKWGNLVRMALGVAVCVWLAMRLVKGPETARGYWVWLYLGLVAVPFAVICLIAVW